MQNCLPDFYQVSIKIINIRDIDHMKTKSKIQQLILNNHKHFVTYIVYARIFVH